MEILCFDASGSTASSTIYWDAIENLAKSNKFDALLSWSSSCIRVNNVLDDRAFWGTSPRTFMDFILREFNKDYISKNFGEDAQLSLHVTTDGQIDDSDVRYCADVLVKPNFPSLKKVVVHYIGHESYMNFGLNAVFGSVSDLSFTINDINAHKKVPSVEDLENYDDIFAPEFLSYLCSRVTDLKKSNFEAFDRLRKKLIAKLEKKQNECNKPIFPREYYDKDDAAGLENVIKERLFRSDHSEYQNKKNKILGCFDKITDITLADIRGRGDLSNTVLTQPDTVTNYELSEEMVIEDSITFSNIDEGKICILVKFDQPALFNCDSKFIKNPLSIFHDETTSSKIIKRFELHPLSISTVKQLIQGKNITSPFTRDVCRAFILGPSNMNEINFNSAALASLFESEQRDKIYGDKLLWQLVILYLIKTHVDSTVKKDESVAWPRDELHPLVNAILKEYIFNEKLLYNLTLHIKIALPVKRVPLFVALWYILRVAPFFATNSSRNVLRYPGASILLNLFEDSKLQDKIPLDDETIEKLHFKVKLWGLWSEMLARRNDLELRLTTRSDYQNYCVVLGKIVLLSGPRPSELPAPDIVSGIPPSIVENMWNSLSSDSARFDQINEDGTSLKNPEPIIFLNRMVESDEVYHMEIDPITLRCTEICPVTKKPSLECAGEFDVKSESYARIFSLFCDEYKRYPENSDELVLLHNRKRAVNYVSSKYIANYMKHVFKIYQPLAKTMSCEEFVEKYNQSRKYYNETKIEKKIEEINLV
ncbi:hypothetical protein U1Q18_048669 [Sarracenia purpurea var. burkii]